MSTSRIVEREDTRFSYWIVISSNTDSKRLETEPSSVCFSLKRLIKSSIQDNVSSFSIPELSSNRFTRKFGLNFKDEVFAVGVGTHLEIYPSEQAYQEDLIFQEELAKKSKK